MVELLFAVCMAASGQCRDVSLLYDASELSLLTCAIAGPSEAARWQDSHPGWRVVRWRCGVAGERGASA